MRKSIHFIRLFTLIIILFGCSISYAENKKVTIRHYPPDNPYNPQTITVSENALKDHLAHGDLLLSLDQDAKGYILPPLSAPALILHNSYYQDIEPLELINGEEGTYDEYLGFLIKSYGIGPFMKTLERITPELENALNFTDSFRAADSFRELPNTYDLQIAENLELVQDRIVLQYKLLDERLLKILQFRKGLVDLFVPEDLYDSDESIDVIIETATQTKTIETNITVQTAIDRYIDDLEAAGYWVKLYRISGGDHTDIKATLVSDQVHGLVGAVLIGTLPAAWYRNANDAHGNVATFPIDLYYMDLDGTWGLYANDNDFFDSHTGDVAPEIWVGRILGNLPTTE